MKFMVLMYADPAATAAMTAEERADVFARHDALHRDLAGTGELLNGAGLAFPRDTVTLRWRGADAPVEAVAGPIAGTGAAPAPASALTSASALASASASKSEEHVTAYYVLECSSAERAREIAERVLDFHVVAVEVRPVHDSFGMDEEPAQEPADEADGS